MSRAPEPPADQILASATAERSGVPLPVLLTVDDDPSVSRSVARDLRRR